jgi:hypothetical protein
MFVYSTPTVANGTWYQIHPGDSVLTVIVVKLSHNLLLYYLYVNYVQQTWGSIWYNYGRRWCTAVVKYQVPFTVHILCFTYNMTPSFGGLLLSLKDYLTCQYIKYVFFIAPGEKRWKLHIRKGENTEQAKEDFLFTPIQTSKIGGPRWIHITLISSHSEDTLHWMYQNWKWNSKWQ